MRRRSERKRSTDVTSPAQPPVTVKRSSNRRSRKASTPDREKNQKQIDQSHTNENEVVGKHDQTEDSVRKTRRARRRTPKCDKYSPPPQGANSDCEPDDHVDSIPEETEISLQELNHEVVKDEIEIDNDKRSEDNPVFESGSADENLVNAAEIKEEEVAVDQPVEQDFVVPPATEIIKENLNKEVTNIPTPKAIKEEELKTADILEIQTDENEQLMGETGEDSNGRVSEETTPKKQTIQWHEKECSEPDIQSTQDDLPSKELKGKENIQQLPSSNKNILNTEIGELVVTAPCQDDTKGRDITNQRIARKRKWVSNKSSEHNAPILAISTDSLRNIISDVQPVPVGDVKLESSEEEGVITDDESDRSPTPDRRHLSRKLQVDKADRPEKDSKPKEDLISPDKTNERKTNFAAATAVVAAAAAAAASGRIAHTPSPPRNRTSNILYITNLVRPFTVLQLKGLLARTGQIIEDGFWIDRIKSKCYVAYENEDQAVETRHALHGVRWPNSNPKALNVDFGSQADMDRAKQSTLDDSMSNSKNITKDSQSIGSGWNREQNESVDRKLHRPVREWDLGKKENLERDGKKSETKVNKSHSDFGDPANGKADRDRPDRHRSRDRNLRSRSNSPARRTMKLENEPPARLLDDLFRKTKGSPCIYWLPLTPEQIAEKEIIRQKRMEEQKERARLRDIEREKERMRETDREKEWERRRERDRERDLARRGRDNNRRNRSAERHRDRVRSRSRDRRRF